MTVEATIAEMRALIDLADLDAHAPAASTEAGRRRREAHVRTVHARLLERYERLLRTGRDPVVAAIVSGSCGGCHLRLPTMIASRARKAGAMHVCPQCGRLLYAPELLEPAPAVPEEQGHHRGTRATTAASPRTHS